MKIGFIGLGAMGRPMARNLASAGHEVVAWNRTLGVTVEGVGLAESAAAVGASAEPTVVMVSEEAAVRQVLFGPDGWCAGAAPDDTVIQSSTIGPQAASRVAADLAARGFRMLDAPVSGSVKPAEAGQLTVLGGGEPAEFERFESLFAAIAARTVVFGPVGAGSAVKLAVNGILISVVAAAAEALTWLIDTEPEVSLDELATVLERISPIVFSRTPAIAGSAPSGGFSLQQVAKDMELVRTLVPGSVLAAVADLASEAVAQGLADRDLAALGEAARRRSPGV